MSMHAFAISAYGDSPYLASCIASLKENTEGSSIILCTSTPKESIRKAAGEFQVPLYIRDGKSSLKDDWNFAIETAVSETGAKLVTVAHQDDVYHKEYASALLENYRKYPDLSVFFTGCRTVGADGKPSDRQLEAVKRKLRLPLLQKDLADRSFLKKAALCFGNSVACPTCTYNIEKTGLPLFQNDLSFVIDWDTLWRLAAKDGRFVYAPEELVDHRIHAEAETVRKTGDATREKEERMMYEKMWPAPVVGLLMKYYKKAYTAYDRGKLLV